MRRFLAVLLTLLAAAAFALPPDPGKITSMETSESYWTDTASDTLVVAAAAADTSDTTVVYTYDWLYNGWTVVLQADSVPSSNFPTSLIVQVNAKYEQGGTWESAWIDVDTLEALTGTGTETVYYPIDLTQFKSKPYETRMRTIADHASAAKVIERRKIISY